MSLKTFNFAINNVIIKTDSALLLRENECRKSTNSLFGKIQNNTFTLILNADNHSYLNIKAIKKNDLFNKSFSNKFSTDKIKENKYFFMFDNLKEICDEISERIQTKGIKLIENANNLIFAISLLIAE